MAEAPIASLVEWGIKEQVIGICFGTTSSNTGIHAGTCTLIEKLLQKEFLKHTKKAINVINDCAECGVALISQCNEILTKNEEQRQYLLNAVQQYRDKIKSAKKSSLIQMNTD